MDLRDTLTGRHEYLTSYNRTPENAIQNLRSLCAVNDLDSFQSTLAELRTHPDRFAINDLGEVLSDAIEHNKSDFASKLLQYGYPIVGLHAKEAIFYKSKDVLMVYLEAGWDINDPIDEISPLYLGATSYAVLDRDLTAWLLDRGANPNQRSTVDCTPLSYAVQLASMSVIRLMLERGGDLLKGQLLQYCVYREDDVIDVLSLLLEKGAPINATMSKDRLTFVRWWVYGLGTALHIAVQLGKFDVIRYLMESGADMNVKDALGRTALELAKVKNQRNFVAYLENWSRDSKL
ncbi:hypothetical protein N7462_008319 [Penicillium macrosclerotiorum]|uniref:uncharacterized protein n=1 Tax=Penicillium macrosclerotiorum TaxID=303699 RepID=UPI002549430A|nr:uncharacterized protein N7462_008319 [Penicillium macrosclerotiorum]KAJ5675422.1 hypothetical protein N7462_008319 [Penicillium macrosclerotiorum]